MIFWIVFNYLDKTDNNFCPIKYMVTFAATFRKNFIRSFLQKKLEGKNFSNLKSEVIDLLLKLLEKTFKFSNCWIGS